MSEGEAPPWAWDWDTRTLRDANGDMVMQGGERPFLRNPEVGDLIASAPRLAAELATARDTIARLEAELASKHCGSVRTNWRNGKPYCDACGEPWAASTPPTGTPPPTCGTCGGATVNYPNNPGTRYCAAACNSGTGTPPVKEMP